MPSLPKDERETRLGHACRLEQVSTHGVLPGRVCHGLDHPPEQAPAHVRVRPEIRPGFVGGNIRDEPREGAVILIGAAVEVELERHAERKPGSIRKEVAQRDSLDPLAIA
jgi:hypothetical protein